MSTSKFKTLACSLSVISVLMLAGCGKKAEDTPAPASTTATTVAPEATPAPGPAPQASPAEAFEKTGLFTGQFEPSEEFKKAKAEYDKWAEESGDGDTRDIKFIPAPLRPYMYQNPLYGYYSFISPNRLSIVIDEVRDDKTFSAHSVAAGNQRLITGTWEPVQSGLRLIGSEPGDEANDGSFDMTLNSTGLYGNWTPKTGKATPKAFNLVKTKFEYNPELAQDEKTDDYVALGDSDFGKNPSVDKLKSKDVENLTQPQIRVIRNLVFARHGYSFKGKDLRLMFESYPWYTPVTNDVKDTLTEIEKANIALLNRYEKYAEKHYDEFGR